MYSQHMGLRKWNSGPFLHSTVGQSTPSTVQEADVVPAAKTKSKNMALEAS